MKLFKYLLLVIISAASLSVFAKSALNEQSVSDLIKTIESNVHAKDAEELMSHFSSDAMITFDLPENMGGKQKLTAEKYKLILKQGWSAPVNVTYKVENVKIVIAEDEKSALVTDVVTETIEKDGKTVVSIETHEKVTIQIVDGKLMVTDLYGKINR